VLFAEEEMRAWSFWSAGGQEKGPHGKGTHPSDWGLGAAREARTPRKTVLKRVKMGFILGKQGLGEVKSAGVLWSHSPRNGHGERRSLRKSTSDRA
jgi:hypothetical protein